MSWTRTYYPYATTVASPPVGYYNVILAGATGNGTTDDSASIIAADATATAAGEALFFPPGTYLMGTSHSFTSSLIFVPGALLSVAASTTETFTAQNPINAGLFQIFSGVGKVKFVYSQVVYPEWWGAIASTTFDSAPAINAAIQALGNSGPGEGGVVQLQPALYSIGSTIVLNTNYTALIGYGSLVTEIQCLSAIDACYVLYPGTVSSLAGGGGTNPSVSATNFLQWPQVRGIGFIQPTPTGTTSGGVGLTLCYTSEAKVEDVAALGFYVGVYLQRANDTLMNNIACNNTYASGPNNSIGFYIDGSPQPNDTIPTGGNGSSRFLYCSHSNVSSSAYAAYGFYIRCSNVSLGGTVGDLHFLNPETSFCNYGMYYDLRYVLTNVDGAANIIIDNPTFDSNVAVGLYIYGNIYTTGASQSNGIKITGGVFNIIGNGAASHIALLDCRGVTISGVQFFAPPVASTGIITGITLVDCRDIVITGNNFMSLDHWIFFSTSTYAPAYCIIANNKFYGSAEVSGVEGGHTPNPGIDLTGIGHVLSGNTFDGKYGSGVTTGVLLDGSSSYCVATSNIFNKSTAAPAAGGSAVAIYTNTLINSGASNVLANNVS